MTVQLKRWLLSRKGNFSAEKVTFQHTSHLWEFRSGTGSAWLALSREQRVSWLMRGGSCISWVMVVRASCFDRSGIMLSYTRNVVPLVEGGVGGGWLMSVKRTVLICFYALEAHIMYLTVVSWFLISLVIGGSGPSKANKFLYAPAPPPPSVWPWNLPSALLCIKPPMHLWFIQPVQNVLDACISITKANGRGLGPGIRVFRTLWNGIQPIGECHLGSQKLENSY